jgi:methyl-accepting chemotaxis protein
MAGGEWYHLRPTSQNLELFPQIAIGESGSFRSRRHRDPQSIADINKDAGANSMNAKIHQPIAFHNRAAWTTASAPTVKSDDGHTWLHRLSVREKLVWMISISVLTMAGLGIFFVSAVNEIKVSGPIYKAIAREMDLRSDILPPPEFIVETHLTVLQIENALRSNPTQIDELIKRLDGLKHDYEDRQSYWKETLPNTTPLEKRIRDGILTGSKDPAAKYFQVLFAEFLPAIQRKDDRRANQLISTELEPLYRQHKSAIEQLADLTQKSQSLREQDAKQRIAARVTLLIAGIALSLVLILGVGAYIIVSITTPLQRAVLALQKVAGRDLTASLEVSNKDEIGTMAIAFNVAIDAIRNGFADAGDIAKRVSHTSSELTAAAGQLSDGTQSQASGIVETSASLEQLTATVKHTADNAVQARDLSRAAAETAAEGIEVTNAAIHSMEEISAASAKIGDITLSIDEIAFDTNILAVNAAIEAAKAGELGNGFAVVAVEVRSLAQRSAAAVREINLLIKDAVAKVGYGSAQVNRSGKTLHEIVHSVKRVANVVAEISNACSEQSLAIDNVNQAVANVDAVTQVNAAQSEELSATAKLLLSTSAELEAMVQSFRV